MKMPDGWVKIHRKFQEWEWYDKSEMVHLFLHLLLSANVSDKQWHGMEIRRGQLVTSYESLRERTGLSVRTLRTCLEKLEQTGEITRKATNKFSIVTVCNYESYQDENFGSDKQTTSKRQPEDQPMTKTKKTKDEIKSDTDKRRKEFYKSLIPFVNTYGKEMVREFYDYWSESNKSGSKMRYEQEPTWDLARRLVRWSNNYKSYKCKSNGADNRSNNESSEERAAGAANIVARLLSENKPSKEVW